METNSSAHGVLTRAINYYEWIWTLADDRAKGMLFVDSPKSTILLTLGYLFVVWIGPKIMRDRKPFQLRQPLLWYNLAMTALNGYICIDLWFASRSLGYSYTCQPHRVIYSKNELRIVNGVWWFYFSKCLEFSDSLFFILRKKNNQLSFLHVYHHSTMFPLWWIGVKWVPSGSSFFPAMANSFVHVIMYSYYALSTIPSISKYLWWKKYLTIIQMIQFICAMSLGINAIRTDCDYPKWMQYALVGYMLSFIALFGNFYAKMYLAKGKRLAENYMKHSQRNKLE